MMCRIYYSMLGESGFVSTHGILTLDYHKQTFTDIGVKALVEGRLQMTDSLVDPC